MATYKVIGSSPAINAPSGAPALLPLGSKKTVPLPLARHSVFFGLFNFRGVAVCHPAAAASLGGLVFKFYLHALRAFSFFENKGRAGATAPAIPPSGCQARVTPATPTHLLRLIVGLKKASYHFFAVEHAVFSEGKKNVVQQKNAYQYNRNA